jgi:hypothetical protein
MRIIYCLEKLIRILHQIKAKLWYIFKFKNVFLKPQNRIPNELYSLFVNGMNLLKVTQNLFYHRVQNLNNSQNSEKWKIILFSFLYQHLHKIENPKHMFFYYQSLSIFI